MSAPWDIRATCTSIAMDLIPHVEPDRVEPLSLEGIADCARGVLLLSGQARAARVLIPAAEMATIPGQEGRRCTVGPLMPWDECVHVFVGEGAARVVFALVESEEP